MTTWWPPLWMRSIAFAYLPAAANAAAMVRADADAVARSRNDMIGGGVQTMSNVSGTTWRAWCLDFVNRSAGAIQAVTAGVGVGWKMAAQMGKVPFAATAMRVAAGQAVGQIGKDKARSSDGC